MNTGRELLRSILEDQDIKHAINSGLDRDWVLSPHSGSSGVFSGTDKQAYLWLLDHWAKHRKVPSVQLFRENFPEDVLPFDPSGNSLGELVEQAQKVSRRALMYRSLGEIVDLYDKDEISTASDQIQVLSRQLVTKFTDEETSLILVGDPDFDIERMLNQEIEPGVPLGVPTIDEDFYGFQPGHLITLLGRQKSGKTTLIANSVYQSWREGYRSLFFSVEMDPSILIQRILSIGAHVDPEKFRRGQLSEAEKKRVQVLHKEFEDFFHTSEDVWNPEAWISKKRALITMDDVVSEYQKTQPHIIHIDGFYFMKDRISGKIAGPDWQAQENLAAELKAFAVRENVAVFVTTQSQEKQYDKEAGVEASSMMGGTALLRYSDLILGLDKDFENKHHITNLMSRFAPVRNVDYFVNYPDMTFTWTVKDD